MGTNKTGRLTVDIERQELIRRLEMLNYMLSVVRTTNSVNASRSPAPKRGSARGSGR